MNDRDPLVDSLIVTKAFELLKEALERLKLSVEGGWTFNRESQEYLYLVKTASVLNDLFSLNLDILEQGLKTDAKPADPDPSLN